MAIGYACVHIGSEATKLSALKLATATPDDFRRVITQNLNALREMIRYNADHDIRLFRISSDSIPFGSHPAMPVDWQAEFGEALSGIGEQIRQSGIRVSMHPGQYTVLNSKRPAVVANAIADLRYHNAFLDALGCDTTHKIIIHIGGVYADKPQAMKRFVETLKGLDERVRARLVIENDDTLYTVEDALFIAGQTGLPVVFDIFHHLLNHAESSLSPYDWIDRCAETWGKKDGKPKIHYSQPNAKARGGAHSDTIDVQEFLRFYNQLHQRDVDILLEVKDKNLSAIKCILATMEKPPIRLLEAEWARYKYLVLGQSAAIYQKIRTLLKNKANPQVIPFYTYIDEALAAEENKGEQVNAAQHVWGYVSDVASPAETKQFQTLLKAYRDGSRSLKAVKGFLFRMAKQQNIGYLMESLYFYR